MQLFVSSKNKGESRNQRKKRFSCPSKFAVSSQQKQTKAFVVHGIWNADRMGPLHASALKHPECFRARIAGPSTLPLPIYVYVCLCMPSGPNRPLRSSLTNSYGLVVSQLVLGKNEGVSTTASSVQLKRNVDCVGCWSGNRSEENGGDDVQRCTTLSTFKSNATLLKAGTRRGCRRNLFKFSCSGNYGIRCTTRLEYDLRVLYLMLLKGQRWIFSLEDGFWLEFCQRSLLAIVYRQ